MILYSSNYNRRGSNKDNFNNNNDNFNNNYGNCRNEKNFDRLKDSCYKYNEDRYIENVKMKRSKGSDRSMSKGYRSDRSYSYDEYENNINNYDQFDNYDNRGGFDKEKSNYERKYYECDTNNYRFNNEKGNYRVGIIIIEDEIVINEE